MVMRNVLFPFPARDDKFDSEPPISSIFYFIFSSLYKTATNDVILVTRDLTFDM